MSEKLLPCPFCGGDAKHVGPYSYDGELSGEYVRCTKCTVRNERHRLVTEPDAITAWNTRVAMQADAAPVAWMPIETAPKDGTAFQATIPGHGSDNVICWADGLMDSHGEDCGSWVFASEQEPPECWTDGYCWAVNEDGVPSVQPTHWMPLPTPPVVDHPPTSSPVVDHETGNTSDKLRPAVEVWRDASEAYSYPVTDEYGYLFAPEERADRAAAVIEADRQATRAALVAEIVEWLDNWGCSMCGDVGRCIAEDKWGKR